MSFGAPQWFWGLLVIPLVVALFVWAERRGAKRLQEFASARLLPQLAGTVDRFRRVLRFGLLLLGLALAIVSLAQPRWGYTFQDVQRKGLDLFFAVDTSRSMLSNDVQPNRLERVKLATQDLINELQGDRVGLIAFAGRAFVQAPLTIDDGAVVEAINDLDTKTIPEGGTNISQAIALALETFGKSATGNRALIIFTDGEELSGDAIKSAKAAADAGVRIFTVGVGTPQGSLIPLTGENGGTAFVKDTSGQVVKSKLDEKRLREIAQATGGFYQHLENGPQSMKQLYNEGIAKMTAADFDVRLSRRPIERYEWPLGAAIVALAMSMLIGERKRVRVRARSHVPAKLASAATATVLAVISLQSASATAPGLQLYQNGKYGEAYQRFQEDLKNNPDSPAKDKIQFDSGAAAYKMRDYNKAVDAFSEALLTKDKGLQEDSHFNMGRTLEERADMSKSDEDALKDLGNAQTHYEDVLKLDPKNKAAKANLESVKEKIERLKRKREKPTPPPQQPKQDKKQKDQDQQSQDQKNDQKQQNGGQDQQQKDQQSGSGEQDRQSQQNQQSGRKDQEKKDDKAQAKNDQSKQDKQEGKAGETPTPSPSEGKQPDKQENGSSPSPSPKGNKGNQPSPSPGETGSPSPSPSPGDGEGSGENATPSPAPSGSPQKKLAGEVKGASGDKPEAPPDKSAEMAEAEAEKEGKMSERQAEALLRSLKDEEARVQLDERKATRRVYNDW
jgi:Ca-activated chloride channel family protein